MRIKPEFIPQTKNLITPCRAASGRVIFKIIIAVGKAVEIMEKKKGRRPAAVIEIGLSSVNMRIAQIDKASNMLKELEAITIPVQLGHEVFGSGKVSFESLRDIAAHIKNFLQLFNEYGVESYRVVAASALRGAENRAYVADRLHIQTGVNVETLEDSQEKSLIYHAVLKQLSATCTDTDENALLSYIGAGSISIAHCIDGKISYSQNISLGSLRLGDMLKELENETEKPYPSVEEYLENALAAVAEEFSGGITRLYVAGTDTQRIAQLCGAELKDGIYKIKRSELRALYEAIRALSTEAVALNYNLSYDSAEVLYAGAAIYMKLAEFTKADEIIAPSVQLSDAVLWQLLEPSLADDYAEHVRTNALACADRLAQHYHSDMRHCDTVAMLSCTVFDRMKKIHGLTSRERLLLELAAKLHDCGYYVNSHNHHLSTYYLIKNSAVYGLTEEDISLVAQITQYSETHIPAAGTPGFYTLTDRQRLMVSKLAAILRLANAMDKSHKSKIGEIKIKLPEEKIIITTASDQTLFLEKWAFKECAAFFREVFGISPELIIKTKLLK